MKFAKPRELKSNDYPDSCMTARDVEKVDSGENNARDRQYLHKVSR